ncbi:hypothetical protein APY04_0338 [Hyphomicrobium sulfonivorans]|uniref:Uncharacterized protein n=1 Tax=Hyphomicrobium sulfonivorans TaxID=121290 RepID=A0A125NW76_HYPSL|nr:hypothetical protein APY04_0338 [Hyphomicrobium sulfonivorans]
MNALANASVSRGDLQSKFAPRNQTLRRRAGSARLCSKENNDGKCRTFVK